MSSRCRHVLLMDQPHLAAHNESGQLQLFTCPCPHSNPQGFSHILPAPLGLLLHFCQGEAFGSGQIFSETDFNLF